MAGEPIVEEGGEQVVLEGQDVRAEDMVEPDVEPGQVEKFYDDATIFVTGSTGFIGKILVEKLLRCLPNVRKVYLLMREKKGKTINERFRTIFDDTLYNRLRNEQPDFERKICIVPGDVGFEKLGLSDVDYEKLVQEVNVIFHVAATVRFDEPLRVATAINVRGTAEILKLSRKMPNLHAIVHVSTAYSNCPEMDIEEKFYDISITPEKLFKIVDALDDEQLALLTPQLIGKWPNTYVFTKAVAERLIAIEAKGLPISVIRPSIVVSTAREPIPGWIDNLYGATGIAVGAAVGLLRTLHCDPNNVADMIPADYVVNAMIVSAWNVGTFAANKESSADVSPPDSNLYNLVGSTQAPITWKEYMALTELNAFKIPSELTIWHYCFRLNPNWYIHMLFVYLLHFFPAYIVDFIAICLGKKPQLVKGYQKINKFARVISYFSIRQWTFHNDNVQRLWKKLKPRDKEVFEFNMGALNWGEFFYSYVRGMRVYLLKDPLDTIPKGRIKFWKLKIAHYTLVCLLLYGIIKLFLAIFSAIFL